MTKFTFNFYTGKVDEVKKLVTSVTLEFPVINRELVGLKSRFTYISHTYQKLPEDAVGQQNIMFEGFHKYDLI